MTISPRSSRALALGLLAATCIALYSFVARPLIGVYAQREQKISLLSARAERVAKAGADPAANQAAARALRQSGLEGAIYWRGPTEAVAAAGLQQNLRALLREAQIAVESVDTISSTGEDGMHKIGVKLKFSADIDQLAQILQRVESTRPGLWVERLAVQPLNSTRADAPALAIELQVAGLADIPTSTGAGT